MGDWSIVVPEAATNLVTNPSAEIDTTGYTLSGTALTRITTDQRRGVACLRITPSAGPNDGVYYAITLVAAATYAVSLDFKGATGVPYYLHLYDTVAGADRGSLAVVGDGKWHRYSFVATNGPNTALRIYVAKNNHASTADFFIDGVQCEAADHATTYVDGDQDGCVWNGTPHASTSTRSAQSRAGGREVNLDSGTDTIVVSDMGAGMPPVELQSQARALLPGSHYRGTRTGERVITLMISATGGSLTALHQLRQALVDLVKPDRTADPQPFLLRYRGVPNRMLEIPVVYDAGLQGGDWKGMNESLALRLIAHDDPLWREEGDRGVVLSANQSLTVNYIAGRVNGDWSGLGTGMHSYVYALAVGPDGTLYAGGLFQQAGGGAAMYVAKWNGSAWSALGTGMDSEVRALAIGADGTLYAGGSFTMAGGGAAAYIAKWNGSAWSALGTGMNSGVRSLAIAPNGDLYASGDFTTAGGVTVNRVAKWNGSAWSALGTGMDAYVYAIAFAPDGTLYAGGNFTTAGGTSIARIAKWNGSAWSALGSGMNDIVYSLAVGLDGSLYAGGSFTTAGGASIARIAKWNGSAWSALGTGVDSTVWALAVGPDGTLYVGGYFSVTGLPMADRFVKWNGSVWSALDIDLPGNATGFAIAVTSKGDLYLGFDTTGSAAAAVKLDLVATAVGTAACYPVLTVKRTGGSSATLQQIKNVTTGKSILFNCPLADGETVTIDLRPGRKMVTSSVIGNALARVLPNSDFATFALQPGDNRLTAYVPVAGSPTVTCTLWWRPAHWSYDGGAA